MVKPAKGVDAILEHIMINNPDFRILDAITKQIERDTLEFIKDIETFFAKP